MRGRTAVFVDRDGVINALAGDPPESPLRVEDVALLCGVPASLRRCVDGGLLLVGVSNQPAAAKGQVSQERLDAIQHRVLDLLAAQGVHFDAFQVCPHHPDGVVTGLAGPCDCRKPAPGMLLAAAAELDIDLARSWMIGDTDSDIEAGLAAGCRTILIEHPPSAHKRTPRHAADLTAADLTGAVELLLDFDRVSSAACGNQ